ncbi:MAG: hypothetical protein ACLFNI_07715 [Natronomonas sp.]
MGVCSPLRSLVDFVEDVERNAGEVSCLQLPDRITNETPLSTRVEVTVPFASTADGTGELSLLSADVDSDGSLRFSFETTTDFVPSHTDTIVTEVVEAALNQDGTVTAVLSVAVSDDCDSHFANDSSLAVDSTPSSPERTSKSTGSMAPTTAETPPTSTSDRDLPPFEDRELLATVYESYDTFGEMSEALDMDVTAETVRRYMIDHGIHEAASYDTGSDSEDSSASNADPDEEADVDHQVGTADERTSTDSNSEPALNGSDPETPIILADGIGLSEDIDIETLIDAVRKSRTIHEVKEEIGIERKDAVDTLRELNLLDLVVGRLSEDGRTEVTRSEIVSRLRSVSATR